MPAVRNKKKVAKTNSLVTIIVSMSPLLISGLVRVLENLKSPGILLWHFPVLESPGKRPLVLESPGKRPLVPESSGNLLNSAKKYEVYGRQ